jgi:hypothetical protein
MQLDLLGLFNRQQVGSDLISGAFETRHIPRGRESDLVSNAPEIKSDPTCCLLKSPSKSSSTLDELALYFLIGNR